MKRAPRETIPQRFAAFLSRNYITILFAVWTFSPLIRRLIDWQIGYHSLSPIAVLPFVAMIPGLYFVYKNWARLDVGYRFTFAVWTTAFVFSFLVAFAAGSLFGGAFALLQFMVPAGIAGTLLLAGPDYRVTYERSARSLLFCAFLASLYAIYQYVAPPPWDVAFIQNANIVSMGEAVPFGLRVFGPYNSDGPFGIYLVMALVVNLPRMRLSNWANTVMTAPCIVALLLTQVRIAWIGLVIGVAIYLIFAPGKRGPISALLAVFAVFGLFGGVLLTTVRNSQMAVSSITDRLNTFQSLSGDSSVTARQEETNDAWTEGLKDPLGLGLGGASNATKISGGNGGGIDNGFLSRLVEMGIFCWIGYIAALAAGLGIAVVGYFRLVRERDKRSRNIVALAISLQVMLLFFEAGFDNHTGFNGMFFWYSLFFTGAAVARHAQATADKRASLQRVAFRAQSVRG